MQSISQTKSGICNGSHIDQLELPLISPTSTPSTVSSRDRGNSTQCHFYSNRDLRVRYIPMYCTFIPYTSQSNIFRLTLVVIFMEATYVGRNRLQLLVYGIKGVRSCYQSYLYITQCTEDVYYAVTDLFIDIRNRNQTIRCFRSLKD